jgi:hypothetical protein
MFNWLKELLDIRYENRFRNAELKAKIKEDDVRLEPVYEEPIKCESCETLRQQLSIANTEKKALLERILEKPKETVQEVDPKAPNIVRPIGASSWTQRRRELEANDRRNAALLEKREKELAQNKAASPEEVAEFERELDSVATERTGTEGVSKL